MAMTTTVTSLSRLLSLASASAGGFARVIWEDCAVYVACGKAAERRRHAGKIVVGLEWYRPESFDDDDASTGGWLLPLRSGHTRVSRQIVCEQIDAEALRRVHQEAGSLRGRIET